MGTHETDPETPGQTKVRPPKKQCTFERPLGARSPRHLFTNKCAQHAPTNPYGSQMQSQKHPKESGKPPKATQATQGPTECHQSPQGSQAPLMHPRGRPQATLRITQSTPKKPSGFKIESPGVSKHRRSPKSPRAPRSHVELKEFPCPCSKKCEANIQTLRILKEGPSP